MRREEKRDKASLVQVQHRQSSAGIDSRQQDKKDIQIHKQSSVADSSEERLRIRSKKVITKVKKPTTVQTSQLCRRAKPIPRQLKEKHKN